MNNVGRWRPGSTLTGCNPAPLAIVATLPFAVQAAILIMLGLYLRPGSRPWWSYLLALIVSLTTFSYATIRASRRPGQLCIFGEGARFGISRMRQLKAHGDWSLIHKSFPQITIKLIIS
jgi:hypothetical protein